MYITIWLHGNSWPHINWHHIVESFIRTFEISNKQDSKQNCVQGSVVRRPPDPPDSCKSAWEVMELRIWIPQLLKGNFNVYILKFNLGYIPVIAVNGQFKKAWKNHYPVTAGEDVSTENSQVSYPSNVKRIFHSDFRILWHAPFSPPRRDQPSQLRLYCQFPCSPTI